MPARRCASGSPTGVAKKILLDTGVVIALLDARDPDHSACAEVWSELRARIYTVEGVLVEAAHLLSHVPGGPEAVIGLVLDVGATVAPATESRLRRAQTLMTKYRDAPMDLVDALLVVTAEESNVPDVLTLDHRGFRTYRIGGRRRFRILP
jgi:predicted nucleic acid-binding protein